MPCLKPRTASSPAPAPSDAATSFVPTTPPTPLASRNNKISNQQVLRPGKQATATKNPLKTPVPTPVFNNFLLVNQYANQQLLTPGENAADNFLTPNQNAVDKFFRTNRQLPAFPNASRRPAPVVGPARLWEGLAPMSKMSHLQRQGAPRALGGPGKVTSAGGGIQRDTRTRAAPPQARAGIP